MCALNPNKKQFYIYSNRSLIVGWLSEIKQLFIKQKYIVWHPKESGIKVIVVRNFWQKMVYPTFFALDSEIEKLKTHKNS